MVAQPPPRAPGGHDRAKRTFTDGAGAAVLAVVTSAAEAEAAVAGGADLLDLPDAAPDTIAAVRARCPGILLCGAGRAADVVRDAAAARASGALLLCAGIEAARASDLPAGRPLVSVPPGLVQEAAQAGWAVLVDADRAAAQLSRGRAPGPRPPGPRSPPRPPVRARRIRPGGVSARRRGARWVRASRRRARGTGSGRDRGDGRAQLVAGRRGGPHPPSRSGQARAGHGRVDPGRPAARPHRPRPRLGRDHAPAGTTYRPSPRPRSATSS